MMTIDADLAVDFMDMRDDGQLITRLVDARPGYEPIVGAYAIVGDEGAEPAVARIVSIDADGLIDLEVLPGSVDSHRSLLSHA